jgi:subtilisin family serine protease
MQLVSFPARFDYVLAVVSLNKYYEKSGFSNFGDENFWGDKHPNLFAAFGGEKDSESIFYSPFGINGWGTSFSAAYMTGLVAYIWSIAKETEEYQNFNPPNRMIEYLLKHYCVNKDFAAYKQEVFGHGIIKFYSAN